MVKKIIIISIATVSSIIVLYFILNSGFVYFLIMAIGNEERYKKTISISNNKIFIKTRVWGITGNHNYIFFSGEDKKYPEENYMNLYPYYIFVTIDPENYSPELEHNRDLVFPDEEEIICRIENDKLIIYVGSNSNTPKMDSYSVINNIDITIKPVRSNEFDKMIEDIEKNKYIKINVYKGIK